MFSQVRHEQCVEVSSLVGEGVDSMDRKFNAVHAVQSVSDDYRRNSSSPSKTASMTWIHEFNSDS